MSKSTFTLERDQEIFNLINKEAHRQEFGIELIASENFVSKQVMEAQGSVLTNKYAEGLPGKRYYGGCEVVDVIENIAIDRAKELFGATWANVQPHSGAQANAAVFLSFLNPGDKILGFNLSHGGHLSHGSPVNFSGKYFQPFFYGVEEETGMIDWDKVEEIALREKPRLIICGASAYARDWDYARLRAIADEVGALLLGDISHPSALICKGLLNNPMQHCHIVTTTTHKTLRGPRGGLILCKAQYAKAIDKAVFPGTQGGPLMHIIAAKAVALGEALKPDFKVYQQGIIDNCQAFAQGLLKAGFRLVSGGTDNHLVLVDVRGQGLTGKAAEHLLDEIGITCNKNTIPFDPASPFVTSGIRLGTAAVTTRGFKAEDMLEVAAIIGLVLNNPEDVAAQKEAVDRVAKLCAKYPMYPGL